MKRLFPALLLVVMALAVLTLSGCGEEYGTVQGTVTRPLDPSKPPDDPSNASRGIADAEIIVYALEKYKDVQGLNVFRKGDIVQRATTDAAGAFSFSLFKGEYIIEVAAGRLIADSRQIKVKGGRTTEISLSFEPAP